MGDDDDRLFRFTFTQPRHAASLLRGVLPPAIAHAVRWDRLAPLPTDGDDGPGQPAAPLAFTAPLGTGRVLLSLRREPAATQARWPQLTALRDAACVAARSLHEHPQGDRLPPLVAVIVHHGPRAWPGPHDLFARIDFDGIPAPAARLLTPLQPNLHVVLDDLAAQTETALRRRPATALARLTLLLLQNAPLAEHRDPIELAARWCDLLIALLREPGARSAVRALRYHAAARLRAPPERMRAAAALVRDAVRVRMRITAGDRRRPPGTE